MTENDILLRLKVVSDISDVKSNFEEIQRVVNNLGKNLSPDLNFKFGDSFRDFESEYKRFTKLQNTPNKSKSQLQQLEQSGNNLVKIFKDLGGLFNKIDWSKISIDVDSEKLKALEERIKSIKKELGEILNQDDLKGKLDELFNKLPDTSALKEKLTTAVNTGDLEQVQKVLTKISNANFKDSGIKTLASDINNFINTEKITTVNKLNQELEQTNTEIANLKKNGEEAGMSNYQSIGTATDSMKQYSLSTNEAAQSQYNLNHQLDQLKNRILYIFSLNNAINLVRRAFNSTYQAVKNLDEAMTEMAVVTESSVGDYWEQLPEYTERAYELGTSIQSVYESMTLYYQQGLSTAEATSLSTSTMRMARIASLDAEEATQRMTNALRGFNMELTEANSTRVADVYSALAAKSAANVDQISTAMTKVASIAHSANMEFEDTAALLTQIIETTQESAETAGTALKTVIARFSEVKTLTDSGELTSEDEDGDIIDVNKIGTALRTVGIDLNQYISGEVGLTEIFKQLSEQWNDLDFATQKYIATQAAGSRQQSRFIAMMQDYTRTTELMDIAWDANGASAEQFSKTLDSLDAKLEQLKTQWQSFTTTIFDQGAIKGVISGLTKLLEIVNKLTGNNGFAKLATAGGIFVGLGKAVDTLKKKIDIASRLNQAKILVSTGFTSGGTAASAQEISNAKKLLLVNKQELGLVQKIKDTRLLYSKSAVFYSQIDNKINQEGLGINQKIILSKQRDAGIKKQLVALGIKESTYDKLSLVMDEAELDTRQRIVYVKTYEAAIEKGLTEEDAKQAALSESQGIYEKKTLTQKLGQWVYEKLVTEEKRKQLTAQAASLVGLGAILAVLGAIAIIVRVIYVNSKKFTEKRFDNALEDLEESESKLQEINDELEAVNEKIDELQSKGPLTIVEQDELNKLKQEQTLLEAQKKLQEKEVEDAQDKTDKIGVAYLNKFDFSQNKRTDIGNLSELEVEEEDLADLGFKIDENDTVYEEGKGYTLDDLTNVYSKVLELSDEARAEWFSSDNGKDFISASVIEGLMSYEDAAKYIVGDEFDFDQAVLDWDVSEDLPSDLKEVTDALGITTDALKEHKAAITSVSEEYGKLTEEGIKSFDDLVSAISSGDVELTEDNITGILQQYGLDDDFVNSLQYYKSQLVEFFNSQVVNPQSWNSITSTLSDFEEKMDDVDSALEELDENGKLSNSSIQDLRESLGSDVVTNDLIEQLTKGGDEAKEAIDKIVTAYIDQEDVLSGITVANKDYYIEALKTQGVVNAEEVAYGRLFQSIYDTIKADGRLTSEQEEVYNSFIKEVDAAGASATALDCYEGAKQLAATGNFADVIRDYGKAFIEQAKSIGVSSTALQRYGKIVSQIALIKQKLNTEGFNIEDAKELKKLEGQLEKLQPTVEKEIAEINSATTSVIYKNTAASKAAEDWVNEYENLYNLTEKLSTSQDKLNSLEAEYDLLLKDASSSSEGILENLIAQRQELAQQKKYYEAMQEYAELELQSSIASHKNKYGDIVQVTEDGTIQVNQKGINSKNSEAVNEYVEELEEILSRQKEAKEGLEDVEKAINDLEDDQLQTIIDFQNDAKDAYIEKLEEEIEKQEELNDAIKDTNDNIIDGISNIINEQREQRELEKSKDELDDKRRQLAYLQQDTSGANATKILQLQKEISEAEEDYTDTLIDNKIDELKEQNDKAQEEREKQTELMTESLNLAKETGAIWNDILVNGMLADEENIKQALREANDYQSMSAVEQAQFDEDLNSQFKAYAAAVGYNAYSNGTLNSNLLSTGIDDTTLQSTLKYVASDNTASANLESAMATVASLESDIIKAITGLSNENLSNVYNVSIDGFNYENSKLVSDIMQVLKDNGLMR